MFQVDALIEDEFSMGGCQSSFLIAPTRWMIDSMGRTRLCNDLGVRYPTLPGGNPYLSGCPFTVPNMVSYTVGTRNAFIPVSLVPFIARGSVEVSVSKLG